MAKRVLGLIAFAIIVSGCGAKADGGETAIQALNDGSQPLGSAANDNDDDDALDDDVAALEDDLR